MLRRPFEKVDLQSKKRQNLIEYALRKKVHSILDISNSKVPFEVVKELSLSTILQKRQLRALIALKPGVLSCPGEAGPMYVCR